MEAAKAAETPWLLFPLYLSQRLIVRMAAVAHGQSTEKAALACRESGFAQALAPRSWGAEQGRHPKAPLALLAVVEVWILLPACLFASVSYNVTFTLSPTR